MSPVSPGQIEAAMLTTTKKVRCKSLAARTQRPKPTLLDIPISLMTKIAMLTIAITMATTITITMGTNIVMTTISMTMDTTILLSRCQYRNPVLTEKVLLIPYHNMQLSAAGRTSAQPSLLPNQRNLGIRHSLLLHRRVLGWFWR